MFDIQKTDIKKINKTNLFIFYQRCGSVSGLSLHVCLMCVCSHSAMLQLAVLLAQVWHLRPKQPHRESPPAPPFSHSTS